MKSFSQFIHIEDEAAAYGFLDVLADVGFDYIESAECFGCVLVDEEEEGYDEEQATFKDMSVMVGKWYVNFADEFSHKGVFPVRQVISIPDELVSATKLLRLSEEINAEIEVLQPDVNKLQEVLNVGRRNPGATSWAEYEAVDQGRKILDQFNTLYHKRDIMYGELNPSTNYPDLVDFYHEVHGKEK